MRISKLLISLGLLLALREGPAGLAPGPANPRVLTLLDYFEGGRRAVDAYVLGLDGDPASRLHRTIRRAKRSCVRVEFRSGEIDRYRVATASGVLIDGGRRVLTAGHAMSTFSDARVVVILVDGEERAARVLDGRYDVYGGADRDWAVLEIRGEPVREFPSAVPGEVSGQALAFVLGYPDGIGVDPAGRVAFDAGIQDRRLEPIVTLAAVESDRPLRLSPVAGSIPTSGMSGAPVFDDRGRLVGIFVSIGKIHSASSVTYTYNVASITPPDDRASPLGGVDDPDRGPTPARP